LLGVLRIPASVLLPRGHEIASSGHIFLFMQHSLAAGLARPR